MEYMDLLRPTAPSLIFARETCTPYSHVLTQRYVITITSRYF